MPAALRLFIVSLLLVGSLAAESTPWEKVKIGMSADEVITLLGEPVFQRKGRGFVTWTYDHGAEVLLCGQVIGWTAPATVALAIRSGDVWRNAPKGEYLATVRTAVRQAAAKAPKAVAAAAPKPGPAAGMGYEEYLRTYGRKG